WTAAVCWVALAAGCGIRSPHESGDEGPGGRRQPLALAPKEELAVGRRAYQQILDEFHGQLLPASRPEVVRVRRVTARLAKASEIEPLQREILLRVRGYIFEWEANVIQDARINAFCLPA